MRRRTLWVLLPLLAVLLMWGTDQVVAAQFNSQPISDAVQWKVKSFTQKKVTKAKDLSSAAANAGGMGSMSAGKQKAMDMFKNRVTTAQRKQAAAELAARRDAPVNKLITGLSAMVGIKTLASVPTTFDPQGTPDYMGGVVPNWANSQLPSLDASGNALAGTGIRKFVDSLPGLGAAGANNLGQYMPVAVPDITSYPGSDYYVIELVQYTEKLHSDIPTTTLRGYRQANTTDPAIGKPNYLGPIIIAQRDRPVRVKFVNKLATGTAGDLFIPTDHTAMGAGVGPDGSSLYKENRGTLHLHGGATPWISDGTPNQWITPATENTPYPKGVSVYDVPDMWYDAAGASVPSGTPDATTSPGPGAMTFYYTNQQSARLMFYHDHSYGITRLNVYAGEAAGYLVQDEAERAMVEGGTIGTMTVAAGTIPADQIPLIIQDKTFVPDDAQLVPTDPTWDPVKWGGPGNLWFPHVYMPNQDPSNDAGANPMGRWDYGPWFWPPQNPATLKGKPVEIAPGVFAPGTPNPSLVPEAFMDTPVINGTAYPYVQVAPKAYRLRILNACNDRTLNLQLYYAKSNTSTLDANGKLLNTDSGEVPMVTAAPGNPTFPATWPTDGRDGGVPDPTKAGPHWFQIGTEGGFLPKPVVVDQQPVAYNYNRRDIVVLNIQNKSLMLGPAERADVIVDFSGVPSGSKLILYSDAPAPVPAFDPRIDYYTGDPDQTETGGAPTTKPGYGPNTRTLMQIQVSGAPAASFDETAVVNALPAAFKATQDPIIVPQKAYGSPTDNFVRIQSNSITFTPAGSATPINIALQPKAIQELFELQYGRMNATLGVELPFTNFNTQTTIPLGYLDPITENFTDSVTPLPVATGDGTQLWKITHNGVDTHVIHFHLFNVQVVNRVGWDGAIRPPDANELGWKESVRMNPLEDCIVAMRPVSQTLPFKIGDSLRPLDPTQPIGATLIVTNPLNGNPLTVTNDLVDFGWEYVWHCHLLGHEENDMMRPIKFSVSPAAPSSLTAAPSVAAGTPPTVTLNLTKNWTNPLATSLLIERSTNANFTGATTKLTGAAGATTFVDSTVAVTTTYYYRARAENANSYSSWSNTASALTPNILPLLAPTNVKIGNPTRTSLPVTWSYPAGGAPPTSLRIQYSSVGSGGPWTTAATLSPAARSYTISGLKSQTTYWVRVQAVNALGTASSNVDTKKTR
ncbi:MAG: fibronectin type III domain-containing protein [Actinomycetes bacterium]